MPPGEGVMPAGAQAICLGLSIPTDFALGEEEAAAEEFGPLFE